MEEINVKQIGPDGCCGCKDITTHPNCKEECCTPKTVICTDITQAVCVPAVIDRIYDCICLEDEQMRYLRGVTFTITNAATLTAGDEICVNTISVKGNYCIGIDSSTVPAFIDSLAAPVSLVKSATSPVCTCTIATAAATLSSIFEATTIISIKCCDGGRKVKFAEQDLAFKICSSATIVVEGLIGCVPFTGEYALPNADLTTISFGFKNVDFFGRLCLPASKNAVTFEAQFSGCLSFDCITPTQPYSGAATGATRTFTGDVLASLLINQKVYSRGKEEVVIYTSPNALICGSGNIPSNCQSTC